MSGALFSSYSEAQVESVARDCYMANHAGFEGLPNNRTSPPWENLAESVQLYFRKMAVAAMMRRDAQLHIASDEEKVGV